MYRIVTYPYCGTPIHYICVIAFFKFDSIQDSSMVDIIHGENTPLYMAETSTAPKLQIQVYKHFVLILVQLLDYVVLLLIT